MPALISSPFVDTLKNEWISSSGKAAAIAALLYIAIFAGFFFLPTGLHRNLFYLMLPFGLFVLTRPGSLRQLTDDRALMGAGALFLLFTAGSVLWSDSDSGRLWEKGKLLLMIPAGTLPLYLLQRRMPMLWGVLVQAFVVSAILTAFVLIVRHLGPWWHTGPRLEGFGRAENSVQCGLLYGCAVLAVLFDSGFRRLKWRWRAVLLAAPAVAMILTFSRGPLLSFALTVLAVAIVIYRPSPRRFLAGACVLLTLAAGGFFMLRNSDFLERGDSARLGIWSIALDHVRDHPIIGNGIATKFYYKVRNDFYDQDYVASHAHSLYLSTLIQTGVIGFALLAAFGLLAARRALSLGRAAGEYLPLAWLLMGAGVGLSDFGGYYINLSNEWIVFWFPCAVVAAWRSFVRDGGAA